MIPDKSPRYLLHFRWGAFELRLKGRGPMIAWAAVLASALGIKLFGFL